MQVFWKQELQPPQMCIKSAKCYNQAPTLTSCGPRKDMTLGSKRRLVEKKAISFLFNVKSSAFVVLSVDIKAFSLPHYSISPHFPPPTGLPRVSPSLTCSLILSFTHGLKYSYHRCASLRPHSCFSPDRARVDLSNPSISSRKTSYQTGIPKVYIWALLPW